MCWWRTDYKPMQTTRHYWQLFISQQTDLLVLPYLRGTWLGFSSDANSGAMILNPHKTKALVATISRTVNTPHGDLVLSEVSICASPNIDILGVKFDSKPDIEDHVRCIVSHVSQRISILRLKYIYIYGVSAASSSG